MDLSKLQRLKQKLEECKAEQAKCLGQEQQLEVQKKELMAEFQEMGLTRDTLASAIEQLDKDIAERTSNIDLILQKVREYDL